VLFADLAGFTAWSSTREPAQVFLLLQTLYQNFDLIAKRRRVFKVETIGTKNSLEFYHFIVLFHNNSLLPSSFLTFR
jgi:class 3 adenylate cyclase